METAEFEAEVTKFRPKALQWLRHAAPKAYDPEDLLQEALMKAWRFKDAFKGDSKFSTWLWRIVHHQLFGEMRNNRGRTFEPLAADYVDSTATPDVVLNALEEAEIVRRVVDSLTPKRRLYVRQWMLLGRDDTKLRTPDEWAAMKRGKTEVVRAKPILRLRLKVAGITRL